MSIILKAENISKQYRLGLVGTGTLSDDLKRWWYNIRGKEDPFLKVGAVNDRSVKAKGDYVWALKDINFEVTQGEVLGIIGKNGAGKSTLLKLLSKVTAPTTGSIKSRGRIASLLEIGTGFHPELTGRENIFMNGAILGMSRNEIKSKLDQIINFSGCEMYIDTPVKRYSSGMRVRLGFAVAAHLEPDILVVDEVLAVGDAEFQKKAIGKMQDLSLGEGRTVLFVSHNMASVRNLCSRGIFLENGKVFFSGEIEKCVEQYLISTRTLSKALLSNRNDRKGQGEFQLINLISLNQNKNETEVFLSGDKVIFKIWIKNNRMIKANDLRIDFGLNDSSDNRISWFSTSLFPERFDFDTKSEIVIYLEIPEVPLYSGTYTLTVNLIVNGEVQDWIPHARSFIIENGDFFKTGKILVKKQGSFLIPHKFYI